MNTESPFDATFERIPEPLFKWQYVDRDVNLAFMAWGLQHQFSLATLDDYLQGDGWDISHVALENRAMLIQRRGQALEAFKAGNRELAFAWINFLFVAMRAGKRMEFLLPLSQTGKKFVSGRKPGSAGPVRLAIRRYLKRQPRARAAQIWAALSAKPPKGMSFYDNRLGKYIETDGQPDTHYRHFSNLVSMERRLLAPK